MKLAIIGSGYVGLVSGACFAHLGHQVVCVDNDSTKIAKLRAGTMPIYEPGLESLVQTNVAEGRLSFTTNITEATRQAEMVFICVGTPAKANGEADLSAIEGVAEAMAPAMNGSYKLIVEKSTVPVKTGQWLEALLRAKLPEGAHFDVASNPEFLREGSAIRDFLETDRVVLGVNTDQAASLLVKLYAPLNAPLLITDLNSAELIKHASNAFLAMKISFINAVARICEESGADVTKVAKGVGLDDRIGEAFLKAGVGYGGACFPKDVSAFIAIAGQMGYDFKLLKAVEEINQDQRERVLGKLSAAFQGQLRGKHIAVLGLAFKPNTDDMRGAPSADLIPRLIAAGASVHAYDPVASESARQCLPPEVNYASSAVDACTGADAILLLTEWAEFGALNWPELKQKLARPLVVDGRNLFDPAKMAALGFEYHSVGRPTLPVVASAAPAGVKA